MTAAQAMVILLAMLAATLPFFWRRVFGIFSLRTEKSLAWRLLELLVLYFCVGGLAALLESRAYGSVYPQGWEFYAVTFCLFVVLAFPGFLARYLWRHR